MSNDLNEELIASQIASMMEGGSRETLIKVAAALLDLVPREDMEQNKKLMLQLATVRQHLTDYERLIYNLEAENRRESARADRAESALRAKIEPQAQRGGEAPASENGSDTQ